MSDVEEENLKAMCPLCIIHGDILLWHVGGVGTRIVGKMLAVFRQ